MPARTRAFAILLLAATLLAAGWTFIRMNASTHFDAAAWRAQQGNTALDNPRSKLVPALERQRLEGMTRAEVRRLLGEPDSSNDTSDEYLLGASPVGVDLESYRIEYRQGRVSGAGLVRH